MTLTEVVKMFDIRESDFIYFTIHKEYKFKEAMQLCNIRKSLDMSTLEITKVIPHYDYECGLYYYVVSVHFNETKCKNNEKLKASLIKKRKDDEEYRQKMREEIIKRAKRKRTEINKYWEK